LPTMIGRARDAVFRAATSGPVNSGVPALNEVRERLQLQRVGSMQEFWRRPPLMLVASGKPFEYSHADYGDAVQMIGPCSLDPGPDLAPGWLASIDRPIVLVTTSSEKQGDAHLVEVAMAALADEPVHVVATLPAGEPDEVVPTSTATVCQLVPHGPILDRAVCAVTHGGMGATQKALARGVPVCVVPFGRDQFEVARRVEVAQCGTRLPAKKLSVDRLRVKVREAMTMTDGARRVAEGFAATGGVARGADLFEQRVLGSQSN
jgi:UDP:flavonoid glycosyltransferase YjiC (YdhE family)